MNWSSSVVLRTLMFLWFAVCLFSVPAQGAEGTGPKLPYTPVVTPNGSTLPWRMVNGVNEFLLIVEEIKHEFAPGMVIKAWGYNGDTPGPTIEAVEGDRVRIYVTNKLPEATAVHWHGLLLPSGAQDQDDFERAWVDAPLGRGPSIEDIARTVMYIMATPSLTGQVLTVDGGESLIRRARDVAFDGV